MQNLLLLVSIAAATSDESVDKNVLVTDVIRFYDQDCWSKFCDAEVVSCITESENCQHHFAPLPKMVNLVPSQGRMSTAQPVKEDDAGGGPLLGFENVRWSQLSQPELKVIECAKQNKCAPTEAYVKQDDALLSAAVAQLPAAPSSLLEMGHQEQIQDLKAQVQGLKDMLLSGDTNAAKEAMAEMREKALAMKGKLDQLGAAKDSVSNVASVHSNRMKMLEQMQRLGVDQVQQEKQFIDKSRLSMATSQAKLLRLAQIQEPTESDFMELAQTKAEMDAVRQSMVQHLTAFKKSIQMPTLMAKAGLRSEA